MAPKRLNLNWSEWSGKFSIWPVAVLEGSEADEGCLELTEVYISLTRALLSLFGTGTHPSKDNFISLRDLYCFQEFKFERNLIRDLF